MSVIDKVMLDFRNWQQKWNNGYQPPDIGFMPAGFETEESDERLVKTFQTLMLTVRKANRVKLYAQVSYNHESAFDFCVNKITGSYPRTPGDYTLEENKQSMSIVVTVWTSGYIDFNQLYTPFGGRGKWKDIGDVDGCQKWQINNTLFGFYLLSVGFNLGINT